MTSAIKLSAETQQRLKDIFKKNFKWLRHSPRKLIMSRKKTFILKTHNFNLENISRGQTRKFISKRK